MDNPLANLIVYWIAIGYPTVSPGACPAQLLVFPALNRSESSGQPSSCPDTSAGVLAGALACHPVLARHTCRQLLAFPALNRSVSAGQPSSCPATSAGLLAGALTCRPAHTRCWLQADIMALNQQP